MEKLIESINPQMLMSTSIDGVETYSGLCIRYSPEHKQWIVSYGRNSTINNERTGSGYTVVEAVADFVEKQLEVNKK